MKKRIILILTLLIALLCASSQATLLYRSSGVIYDSTQNLTWTQQACVVDTDVNYSAAITWRNYINTGTYYGVQEGWRLPSSQEFTSLYNQIPPIGNNGANKTGTIYFGSGTNDYFSNIQSYYWTNDYYSTTDTAYVFYFRTFPLIYEGIAGHSKPMDLFMKNWIWFVHPGDVGSTPEDTPKIDIAGNGVTIANGDTSPSDTDATDYGTCDVGASITHTFALSNTGLANLSLTSTPQVALSGAYASDFSVTLSPTSPVSAGGSTSFEIRFNPSGIGVRQATVTIANDDNNKNPYSFTIKGRGGSNGTGGEFVFTAIDYDGKVYHVDPRTEIYTFIGSSGYSRTNSLVADTTGRLITAANPIDNGAPILVEIDQATGVGTQLCTISGPLTNITGLAYSPQGELFASEYLYGGLYKIDFATGQSSLVGARGALPFQDLAFSSDGILYGWSVNGGLVGGLYRIDTNTGTATDVNPSVGDIAYSPQAITFGPDGILYGASQYLYKIDFSTGLTQQLGHMPSIRGMAAAVPLQRAASPEIIPVLNLLLLNN